MDVINPGYREEDAAPALSASISLGSTFNCELARPGGERLGCEPCEQGVQ
jgi:beta-glucosidase